MQQEISVSPAKRKKLIDRPSTSIGAPAIKWSKNPPEHRSGYSSKRTRLHSAGD